MASVASPFRWRSFVTVGVVLSFVLAVVSGVSLFLRPEGSLARWVSWSLLGADKRQWESLHNAAVLLFALLSSIHIWFNWRPLVAHIRKGSGALLGLRRELAAGAALVAVVAAGSLAGWQPFTAVMDLRGSIKDGRFAVRTPPPALDADKLSVNEVCTRVALTPAEAAANARSRGVAIADASRTLGDIATELGLTPEEVFEAVTGTANVRP